MRYSQVDVFTARLMWGNPVAVVHDADGLSKEDMAAFARWTNLSETTFLLAPSSAGAAGGADYRLRIFTPGGELPFAGHPTLGSARAWLEAGGVPCGETVIQECGAGLVQVRRLSATRWAFAAPPLRKAGPATAAEISQVAAALRVPASAAVAAEWIDNGPGWLGVLLADAAAVLALSPDYAVMGDLKLGVVGQHGPGGPADVEMRAFVPTLGIPEDPVTGSLGAGMGGWLPRLGVVSPEFTIRQGTNLRRAGLIHISTAGDGTVWVAGETVVGISGEVNL